MKFALTDMRFRIVYVYLGSSLLVRDIIMGLGIFCLRPFTGLPNSPLCSAIRIKWFASKVISSLKTIETKLMNPRNLRFPRSSHAPLFWWPICKYFRSRYFFPCSRSPCPGTVSSFRIGRCRESCDKRLSMIIARFRKPVNQNVRFANFLHPSERGLRGRYLSIAV